MKLPRRSALLLAASAATLSVVLSVPGPALADPPPNYADVPSLTTTTPQLPESPEGDVVTPAPETSDELYPGPTNPSGSDDAAPQPSTDVPETDAPDSEVPSSETAPEESSAPSSSESAKPAPGRRTAPMAVLAGCQTYPPTTFQVCGRIRDKYNQTGGPAGFLLFPKSNELTNPGNTGKRSEFLGGNIYWSAATDAHPVAHEFLTKWGEKGYESGYLKYPTTDEIVLSDGTSRRQEYQGGSIYFKFGVGAHTVQGAIRDKWRAMNAETGILGFPISDEQVTPDGQGRYSHFENGTIYWSAATGARWVSEDMMGSWGNNGYEAGYLGYPIADPTFNTTARTETQKFQGGELTISDFLGSVEWLDPDEVLRVCNFGVKADWVHISTSKVDGVVVPPTASSHAWWYVISGCPAGTTARIEAQLQTRNPDGVWADRGDLGVNANAKPGKERYAPSTHRANGRFLCRGNAKNTWRLEVDVDINGIADPPGKNHSPERELNCGVI